MTIDPAVASVIASSVVAVSALLFPLLFNMFHERRKLKETKIRELNEAASVLSELIAMTRFRYLHDFRKPERDETLAEINAELIKKYWAWDLSVRPYCKNDDLLELNTLRKKVFDGLADNKGLNSLLIDIDTVSRLTELAKK